VKNSIKKWYQVVIEPYIRDTKESVQSYKYSRPLSIALMLALFVMAGFWGYRWWHRSREAAAQKALGECLYAYQEALQGKDELAWGNVAMLFNVGYEQHSSSALAPYFMMFYADSLLRKSDRAEAIAKMEEAINAAPADSPFINLFKTKLALVKVDDDISAISQEGLQLLKTLADDVDNTSRDMALYYLGLYYWTQDNLNEAKMIWQQLVDAFKHEKIGASPWASLAHTKLEQIV